MYEDLFDVPASSYKFSIESIHNYPDPRLLKRNSQDCTRGYAIDAIFVEEVKCILVIGTRNRTTTDWDLKDCCFFSHQTVEQDIVSHS